jgi:hypothetical protein
VTKGAERIFLLVPRLCLGTKAEKLRFVQEAELQRIRTPKPELGSQKIRSIYSLYRVP